MATTKHLYIIAGCNGAGKTTASISVLPQLLQCTQWVNADEIARGLSPFNPQSVAVEAGRIMLQRIQQLLDMNDTFAIETTLATRSYHKLVTQAQDRGYYVELFFFFLPSPEVAKNRVAHRVKNGGHFIPDDVVERRFHLGLKNLKEIYMPIVDKWTLIYNYKKRHIVAQGNKGQVLDIIDNLLFEEIMHTQEPTIPYLDDFSKRLMDCCREAELNMIKELALHDELVVESDRDGNPIWVKAREILEKNPDLTLEDVDYTPIDVDRKEILKGKNLS